MSHVIYISIIVVLLVFLLYLRYKRDTEAKRLKNKNNFDVKLFKEIFSHSTSKFKKVNDIFGEIAIQNGLNTRFISRDVYLTDSELYSLETLIEHELEVAMRDVIIGGINQIERLVDYIAIFDGKLSIAERLHRKYLVEIKARRMLEDIKGVRQEEKLEQNLKEIINDVVSYKFDVCMLPNYIQAHEESLGSIRENILHENYLLGDANRSLEKIDVALDDLKNMVNTTNKEVTPISWQELLEISPKILECAKKSIQENIDKRYYEEACEIGNSVESLVDQIKYLRTDLCSPLKKEISVSA